MQIIIECPESRLLEHEWVVGIGQSVWLQSRYLRSNFSIQIGNILISNLPHKATEHAIIAKLRDATIGYQEPPHGIETWGYFSARTVFEFSKEELIKHWPFELIDDMYYYTLDIVDRYCVRIGDVLIPNIPPKLSKNDLYSIVRQGLEAAEKSKSPSV